MFSRKRRTHADPITAPARVELHPGFAQPALDPALVGLRTRVDILRAQLQTSTLESRDETLTEHLTVAWPTPQAQLN